MTELVAFTHSGQKKKKKEEKGYFGTVDHLDETKYFYWFVLFKNILAEKEIL